MSDVRKGIFITAGVICLIFGLVGIFIPVLPTTPFLLLAAYLFARSSERALQWLLDNRWFGSYIRNYREGKGMTARQKAITLALLWLTIGVSIIFVTDNGWIRVILIAIATGVTTHLMRMKTYRRQNEGYNAEYVVKSE
jgi:uncharacterized membrane protein YbaN (DUF454 family)